MLNLIKEDFDWKELKNFFFTFFIAEKIITNLANKMELPL